MELQISVQNDLDGRAARALDEAFSMSSLNDLVTRVYEEEPEGTLGVKEDVKNFVISFGAGVAAAAFVELVLSWSALPASCGTKAVITNPSSEPEKTLVVDADNPPSKKEMEDFIQEVRSISQESSKLDSSER